MFNHKNIVIFLSTLFFFACSGNEKQASTPDSETIHSNAGDTIVRANLQIQPGCYQMTLKQDTATFKLLISDTIVTGDLRYDWHEKDGNTGTIKGVLKENMIYADYIFRSEGMTSVREVVFKISGDTLWQAFGELKEKNGKIVFINKSGLQYNKDIPFIKLDCTDLKL